MQNDCEIYVDPEEDEVFFGCVSDREKSISTKLVKCAELSSKDCQSGRVSNIVAKLEEENVENLAKDRQSSKANNEVVIINDLTESEQAKELEKTFDKSDDSFTVLPNNTSVDLDHSYSTPMTHIIDKSILMTPKSVVKADKNGGFLKVLSEIALVKAEAEADKESEGKKEDEDKENKVVQSIPEIRVTEATPEKGSVLSPPKSINTEMRRFRIIYNSPQNEENIDRKSKPHSESFESERNLRNKCLDQEAEKGSSGENRKSVELIDLNESNFLNQGILLDKEETEDQTECNMNAPENDDRNQCNETVILEEEKPIDEDKMSSKSESEKQMNEETNPLLEVKSLETVLSSKTSVHSQKGLRFSREARKIVEVLKKSAVEDTLNFTIPEMDLENEENSFLSPEPVPTFDDTVVGSKNVAVRTPKVEKDSREQKMEAKSKTVEKERKLTPVVSRSRLQPLKYFSERRINKQTEGEPLKCVKKLPMEERRAVEKVNGGGDCHAMPTSRIPVFGVKNSKIPVNDRIARPFTAKTTPSKTPSSGKSHKNPKFNHIESPINAYIHNKPTSLVQYVKPEVKKEGLSKVWKARGTVSGTKLQKTTASAVQLPFVQYKSATPYKIEKKPESRLPRLAPTVLKLIGTNSPKVLKHEGRFYMKTPRKQDSTENSTIVAEANEVSVVVSHPAQKSNTIK